MTRPSGRATERRRREIVVPCGSGKHRVRLARGWKFWRAARCPVCRAPVDRLRFRRVARFWANLRHPAASGPIQLGLWWASVAYVLLAGATALLFWRLADVWWPMTVLLFGPRWVLLLPLALLVPAAMTRDRDLVVPLTLAALGVLGPIMGFRTGWRSLIPSGDSRTGIRVASFNAGGGEALLLSPANLLDEWGVDVAAFQECGRTLADGLRQLPGWNVDVRSGTCLASRLPITQVREMEREDLEFAHGSGIVVTYEVGLDGTAISLTNVHLETPRAGFEMIRAGRLADGIPRVEERSLLRGLELRRARGWVDGLLEPRLVVGDFNTPPESRSYREAWGDWQNAFSLKGHGLGGTRLNGWIRARIDHVVADGHWRVMRSWLGKDVGSDHLPILAELVLR